MTVHSPLTVTPTTSKHDDRQRAFVICDAHVDLLMATGTLRDGVFCTWFAYCSVSAKWIHAHDNDNEYAGPRTMKQGPRTNTVTGCVDTATRPEAQYPDDYASHLAAPSAAKGSRSWHFWPSSSEALKLISSCCRLLLLPKTTGQLRSALNETSSG